MPVTGTKAQTSWCQDPIGDPDISSHHFWRTIMKLQSALSTVLLATVATLSLGAQAADDDKAIPVATEMKADQGAKAAKPHSHVQEKTGIPQSAPAATAPEKKNAAQDRTKHYHPRDGK